MAIVCRTCGSEARAVVRNTISFCSACGTKLGATARKAPADGTIDFADEPVARAPVAADPLKQLATIAAKPTIVRRKKSNGGVKFFSAGVAVLCVVTGVYFVIQARSGNISNDPHILPAPLAGQTDAPTPTAPAPLASPATPSAPAPKTLTATTDTPPASPTATPVQDPAAVDPPSTAKTIFEH